MSDVDNTDLNQEDPTAKTGGDQQPTVEELKAQLEEATREAAKLRNIKKDLEKQRDELKKAKKTDTDSTEDYKQLWQEQQEKATKILEKVKSSDINSAVTAQLGKVKIVPEYAEAAMKLLDKSLVEWDEDTGVDNQSVVAAVQKLKGAYPWMFEKKVTGTDIKEPAGGSNSDKTMKRAEFDKLQPLERHELIRKGYQLVD